MDEIFGFLTSFATKLEKEGIDISEPTAGDPSAAISSPKTASAPPEVAPQSEGYSSAPSSSGLEANVSSSAGCAGQYKLVCTPAEMKKFLYGTPKEKHDAAS